MGGVIFFPNQKSRNTGPKRTFFFRGKDSKRLSRVKKRGFDPFHGGDYSFFIIMIWSEKQGN